MVVKPLQDFTIFVDQGHGGSSPSGDPGAVDGVNIAEKDVITTEEADVNLSVGLVLHNALVAQGARSTMSRSSDWLPTLKQRCDMANNFGANVFISLHCNAGQSSAEGIETLCAPHSINGRRLAELAQQELIKATLAPNRGVKERDNLYVLKHTKMPAILIEMGFITNPGEEVKLSNPQYRQKIVDAIVRAVIRYKKGEKAQ